MKKPLFSAILLKICEVKLILTIHLHSISPNQLQSVKSPLGIYRFVDKSQEGQDEPQPTCLTK